MRLPYASRNEARTCIMRSASLPVLVYSCSLSQRKRPPCSLPRILSSSLLPLPPPAGLAAAPATAGCLSDVGAGQSSAAVLGSAAMLGWAAGGVPAAGCSS
jgi:hypothetical protein